jgi:hypothetical protein
VTASGATVDYGCDSGTIDGPLALDNREQFTLSGTHTFGRGGPSQPDDPPPRLHPARYEGTASGNALYLTVFLPELSRRIGDFQLERGVPAQLDRCL